MALAYFEHCTAQTEWLLIVWLSIVVTKLPNYISLLRSNLELEWLHVSYPFLLRSSRNVLNLSHLRSYGIFSLLILGHF